MPAACASYAFARAAQRRAAAALVPAHSFALTYLQASWSETFVEEATLFNFFFCEIIVCEMVSYCFTVNELQ